MLGERLEEDLGIIRSPDCYLTFDHDKRPGQDPKSAVIPYIHEPNAPDSAKSLSRIDLTLVRNGRLLVLCEVEEKQPDPKKIVGDIGCVLLSDEVWIGDECYGRDGATLLIGIVSNPRGVNEWKANLISEKLQVVFKDRMKGLKIEILCAPDPLGAICAVEVRILQLLAGVGPEP